MSEDRLNGIGKGNNTSKPTLNRLKRVAQRELGYSSDCMGATSQAGR
jgi:hypothetical protein